jgi:hypothetical protein
VSGVTAVTAEVTTVDLTTVIAKGSLDDFASAKHDVVATVVTGDGAETLLTADVTGETLTLTLSGAPGAGASVAWIIDTRPTHPVAGVAV